MVYQILSVCEVYELYGTEPIIREHLKNLPRTLREMYARKLDNLCDMTEKNWQITKSIFQWLVCARRPLTLLELEEAISITPITQKTLQEPAISLRGVDGLSRLSKWCGNLITHHHADRTVSLSHHSVKTFLLSADGAPQSRLCFTMSEAERYLAGVCITYLHFADFERSLTRTVNTSGAALMGSSMNTLPTELKEKGIVRLGISAHENLFRRLPAQAVPVSYRPEDYVRNVLSKHKWNRSGYEKLFQLLEYCCTNWYLHCEGHDYKSEDEERLFNALVLTKTLPFQFRPWMEVSLSEVSFSHLPHLQLFQFAVTRPSRTFYQSWKVSLQLHTFKEFHYWSYISIDLPSVFMDAVKSGNISQICMLLETSKEVGGALGSLRFYLKLPELLQALWICIGRTNIELTFKIWNYTSSLIQHVMGLSSSDTPPVNLQGKRLARYLIYKLLFVQAAFHGNLEMTRRLMKDFPNLKEFAGHQGVISSIDVIKGNRRVSLTNDIESEYMSNNSKGTLKVGPVELGQLDDSQLMALVSDPLVIAVEGGHVELVKEYLVFDYDVNIPSNLHKSTRLLWSSLAFYQNRAGGPFNPARNALQVAAACGHIDLVAMLLEAGATPNERADELCGRTALQEASARGFEGIVVLLLDARANPDACGGGTLKQTALQAAAQAGHLGIVVVLLGAGAAVIHGYDIILRNKPGIPINNGRNDSIETYVKSALALAAENNHLSIVEWLLEPPSPQQLILNDRLFRDSRIRLFPLCCAARAGHVEVVKFLLLAQNIDRCLRATTRGYMRLAAMCEAASSGQLEVLKLCDSSIKHLNTRDDFGPDNLDYLRSFALPLTVAWRNGHDACAHWLYPRKVGATQYRLNQADIEFLTNSDYGPPLLPQDGFQLREGTRLESILPLNGLRFPQGPLGRPPTLDVTFGSTIERPWANTTKSQDKSQEAGKERS